MIALQKVINSLNVLATQEQVAAALGINDLSSKPIDFWDTQIRTVKHRFLWMCLKDAGSDLAQELHDLSLVDLGMVALVAEEYLAIDGFDYKIIREWYKTGGSFEVAMAFDRRREAREIESSCLRVLIIFEKGAKYLAYDDECGFFLAPEEGAHEFPIESLSEREKPYLLEMAKHFTMIMERVGGKQVKILPGKKRA